ncbi:MAG: flagellar basal body P-ring formation chaperone FlgA [Natronospirillum sp.]
MHTRQKYRGAARWLVTLITLAMLLTNAGAAAESNLKTDIVNHITDQILQQYSGASRENVSVDISLPSVVSQLDPCETPISIESSRDNWIGTVRLTLNCSASSNWTYNARATVGLSLPVATLKSSLPRNHVITENDITFQDFNIATLRQGYFLTADGVTGTSLVRNMSQGQVLTHRTIEVPTMIQRGDSVMIIARGTGLQVAMSGTALSDGAHGRQISVRNDSSEQVVRAWVIARGVVEVPFMGSGGTRRP